MEQSFREIFRQRSWDEVAGRLHEKKASDVERALSKPERRDLEDFLALVSPAALPYLEQMAALSQELTQKRFGNTVGLYIPLYLSNVCHNICTYCGFSLHNKIRRITLDEAQVLAEVESIKQHGFDNILLVTGEAHSTAGVDYFERILKLIRPYFSHICIEVQPLEVKEYQRLIERGLDTVYIYQETYNRESYREHHLKGRKSRFEHRLDTPDRLGRAGIHKIGLGALIGLSDWRTDAYFVALHLTYLEKVYWKTRYSISFPRLRPAEGLSKPRVEMSERELLQLITAYRIFNENVELSLSTRERPEFRDNVIKLGITSVSAGSRTEPGGYALGTPELEQFSVADERSPEEVAAVIRRGGQEAVWKDWDPALH